MVTDNNNTTADFDERIRIDKWLWAARFFKTRAQAADAVEGGKVKLNEERVKPAKPVRAGDRMRIRIGDHEWCISVRALAVRRGPAEVARGLYLEDSASIERRAETLARRGLDSEPQHGGRPEKKQRRALRRLRGY